MENIGKIPPDVRISHMYIKRARTFSFDSERNIKSNRILCDGSNKILPNTSYIGGMIGVLTNVHIITEP